MASKLADTLILDIYIIIGVRATSENTGDHRLFANFGGFARPFATYEKSLNQKSSKFALGTCSNCTSPVSPCGVGRYPLINHIYIIKKIRVFFADDFGDKIL